MADVACCWSTGTETHCAVVQHTQPAGCSDSCNYRQVEQRVVEPAFGWVDSCSCTHTLAAVHCSHDNKQVVVEEAAAAVEEVVVEAPLSLLKVRVL